MMRRKRLRKKILWGGTAFALALALVVPMHSANAQSGRNRLRILIGYPPAGGHDLEARVMGRHLSKYLPNNPTIIVQNMPGAGGLIQAAYMYNRAKPDGTTAAIFGSSHTQHNFLGTNNEFDVGKMPIVWAVSGVRVAIARDFLGAKSAKDLLKIDPAKIAVAGRNKFGSSCVTGALGLTVLGVKNFKKVCAYGGTAVIRGAVERGEASFFEASAPHFLGRGAFVELYKKKKVFHMWQSGDLTPDGKIVRSKTVDENTPTFQEAYREAHGKDPSGPLWDAYKTVYNDVHTTLARTLVLPPETPQDIVNTLRKGIEDMSADPAFVKDWEKVMGLDFKAARVPALEAQKINDNFMKPAPWQEEMKKFLGL